MVRPWSHPNSKRPSQGSPWTHPTPRGQSGALAPAQAQTTKAAALLCSQCRFSRKGRVGVVRASLLQAGPGSLWLEVGVSWLRRAACGHSAGPSPERPGALTQAKATWAQEHSAREGPWACAFPTVPSLCHRHATPGTYF